jgi:hypothetical protein
MRWPRRWPARAPTSSRSPARWADLRNSTTRSAPSAAAPRWSRRSEGLCRHRPPRARRSSSAGSGSTSSSAMPACWASFRRSATSSPKVWDEAVAVNLTANWRLIRSLDPLLREAPAGRAVFVTPARHRTCPPTGAPIRPPRRRSRPWSRPMPRRSSKTNVRANLLNPGATRTAMRAKAFPGEDPATLPTPDDVAAAALPLCLPRAPATAAFITGFQPRPCGPFPWPARSADRSCSRPHRHRVAWPSNARRSGLRQRPGGQRE